MSKPRAVATYPPLNTLKRICEDVWIVDGPVIRFGPPWLAMPFPTRMTVLRIGRSDLLVHSPTPLVPPLRAELEAIGTVRWLVGPNRLHYWWIPEWRTAFAHAEVHLAPRIPEQARGRIDFPHVDLGRQSDHPWSTHVRTLHATGRFMTEFVFFHIPSGTLVVSDLIENFERHKLGSWVELALCRIGGVLDPDGRMPRDMRLSFRGLKPQLREAVETMIAWNPERIILAHGRWYESGGTGELRRAFRWLLD